MLRVLSIGDSKPEDHHLDCTNYQLVVQAPVFAVLVFSIAGEWAVEILVLVIPEVANDVHLEYTNYQGSVRLVLGGGGPSCQAFLVHLGRAGEASLSRHVPFRSFHSPR